MDITTFLNSCNQTFYFDFEPNETFTYNQVVQKLKEALIISTPSTTKEAAEILENELQSVKLNDIAGIADVIDLYDEVFGRAPNQFPKDGEESQ